MQVVFFVNWIIFNGKYVYTYIYIYFNQML